MADFSDAEDKHLVQIALKHEIAGTQISWVEAAKEFKKWKHNKEKLRLRLKALKTRFGPDICDFPQRLIIVTPRTRKGKVSANSYRSSLQQSKVPRSPVVNHNPIQDAVPVEASTGVSLIVMSPFESPSASADQSQHPTTPTKQPRTMLEEFNAIVDANSADQSQHPTTPTKQSRTMFEEFNAIVDTNSLSALSSLCVVASYVRGIIDEPVVQDSICYKIVGEMFQSIQSADVRQQSGRPEQNMGEVSMVGVTALLCALDVGADDVFLDVGAGIGNVLAQVALQSRACKVIGIEVRETAVSMAMCMIGRAALQYSQLWRINMLAGDIRAPEVIKHRCVQESTVLYCFSTVFDHTSRLALESLACRLTRLRLVVVADKFCPRHQRRQNCRNEFCTLWTMKGEVQIDVTYSCNPVLFSIYKRK
jgi:Histone methylation protein DOT1